MAGNKIYQELATLCTVIISRKAVRNNWCWKRYNSFKYSWEGFCCGPLFSVIWDQLFRRTQCDSTHWWGNIVGFSTVLWRTSHLYRNRVPICCKFPQSNHWMLTCEVLWRNMSRVARRPGFPRIVLEFTSVFCVLDWVIFIPECEKKMEKGNFFSFLYSYFSNSLLFF